MLDQYFTWLLMTVKDQHFSVKARSIKKKKMQQVKGKKIGQETKKA